MRYRLVVLFVSLCLETALYSQPTQFQSAGIGGGGALFSPSINPDDPNEYYVQSDLGATFHTTDGGQSYEVVPFYEAYGDVLTRVSFTSDPNIRYILKWDRINYARRPARTTDGGQTWTYFAGDTQAWEERFFLFADYDHPNRVVYTTYNEIWVTTDGGQTEHKAYTSNNPGGLLLSGVYFMGDTIYLGTNDGVLVSTDGGQTISHAGFTGIPSSESIMGFGGATDGNTVRFFALTGEAGSVYAGNLGEDYWALIRGVYRMDNLSGTWVKKMSGIDLNQDWAVYLGMARNNIDVCYLAGGTPNGIPMVMKTEDGGETWHHVFLTQNNQNIYTGYAGAQGDLSYWWAELTEGFAVNPLHADQAIFTDFGFIHQTTDGAATWHQAYLDPAYENPAGSPTPKNKYYKSVGMEQTSVWQVYWFDQQTMFGCFTDIRGVRSIDGGQTWSFDYTGQDLNTMYRIVKHNTADIWYGANSSVHDIYQTTRITDASLQPGFKAGFVLYSTDKGHTWQPLRDFGNPVIWVATAPGNDERLYAGVVSTDPAVGGIWRADHISDPANVTWTKLNNPHANNGRVFNIHVLNDGTLVTTWSARKSDSGSVFSDSSGVFVSTDGGQTWERRNHPNMSYWTKDLVVDPTDPSQNTWYACVWSGWGGPANDLGGLYRTTDRGQTWAPMTADGQFHRVSSVTIDPNDPETIYLTTEEQGLWVSHNKSAAVPTWELVSAYHFHHPERVFFNPYDSKDLWVVSFGDGMSHGMHVLPITYSEPLHATVRKDGNLLTWKTSAVYDFAGFTIQRRTGDGQWQHLSDVPPREGRYHFLDTAPNQGINYYRLLEKDKDGHVRPSNVVSAYWHSATPVALYPNPAPGGRVRFTDSRHHDVQVSAMDGRLLATHTRVRSFQLPHRGCFIVRLVDTGQVLRVVAW